MAYCTKCGKELNEGDRFCFNCGEPIPDVKKNRNMADQTLGNLNESETSNTIDEKRSIQPVTVDLPEATEGESASDTIISREKIRGLGRQWNKKKALMIAGVAFFVLLIIIFIIVMFLKGKNPKMKEDAAGDSNHVNYASDTADDTNYVNYVNDTVCFSVDYPEGYMVTEPDSNNVLITDSNEADFQVSIEYAYHTTSNSAIYSAEDFANQIKADSKVLTDWLGSSDVQVLDSIQSKVSGRECYEYDFELQIENHPHTGKLYIFDSDGAFGCYSYMWVVNEDAEKAELFKKQCEAMEESFKITGTCQADGYTVYDYDELDMQFMIRDDAMGTTKNHSGNVVVYPVDGSYTEANIWIDKESYKAEEKDVDDVLELACRYYFKEYDQTKYLSNPTALEYGRYPYTGIDVEFYDEGQRYTMSVFTFVYDGYYWTITMKSTDEYYNTVATAVSDILFSLKLGTDVSNNAVAAEATTEPVDTEAASKTTGTKASGIKGMVADVISDIKKQPGFITDSSWEPLAVFNDFNGDNVKELLAVYEVKKSDGGILVMYELWTFPETGGIELKSDILFSEVGGNSGVIGIVKSGDTNYLAIEQHMPEGDVFNNYYFYEPWNTDTSSLGESTVYMEGHGTFGEEDQGRYILGDTSVVRSDFEARQNDFSDWLFKINILEGAGNGDVMTFDAVASYAD